jgi:hypothetical protein
LSECGASNDGKVKGVLYNSDCAPLDDGGQTRTGDAKIAKLARLAGELDGAEIGTPASISSHNLDSIICCNSCVDGENSFELPHRLGEGAACK